MCRMTNKTKKRVTIFIDPEILIHSKAEALIRGITLSQLIEKAMVDYLPNETTIKIKKVKEQ